jgi:predicted secreted hydrolase
VPLRRIFGIASLLLLTHHAAARDRPGADGYLLALPGYQFSFPRDHGAHDGYRTEWWYYTGHLTGSSGRRYGFEATFFRVATVPPSTPHSGAWDFRDLGLAHFAITDIDRHAFRYYEKLNRWSAFTAAAAPDSLSVFNESWRVATVSADTYHLEVAEGKDAIEFTLRSRKPPAVHGTSGVSVKSAGVGYASHYYSMTRLDVSGTIRSNGKTEACSGIAWMDHEFGSAALRESQQGWDWFSLQFDDNTELMLYQIRNRGGGADETTSGSLVRSDGSVMHLHAGQIGILPLGEWHSEQSGAAYPMGWRITIPILRMTVEVHEELESQELVTRSSTRVTYWEGAVRAAGSVAGIPTHGEGYVEMTGYDRPFSEP